jgi:hypothetical protein
MTSLNPPHASPISVLSPLDAQQRLHLQSEVHDTFTTVNQTQHGQALWDEGWQAMDDALPPTVMPSTPPTPLRKGLGIFATPPHTLTRRPHGDALPLSATSAEGCPAEGCPAEGHLASSPTSFTVNGGNALPVVYKDS